MTDTEHFPDNWVQIMCDWSADPVWAKDGMERDVQDLPVSQSLRDELQRWYQAFQDSTPEGDEDDGRSHASSFDLKAFSKWGLVLARRVKAELPHWTVIYADEWALHQRHQNSSYMV
jgi:hypothetical protein